MTDDQSPDTGPKSGEGLEKVRSGSSCSRSSASPLVLTRVNGVLPA